MNDFRFTCIAKDTGSLARTGVITTPHGDIETPAFVPVGTQGSVKSLTPEEIKDTGTDLFFVNTYHMVLRPGLQVIEKAGGLHTFIGWDGPLITDSGGFQVFSLANNKRFVRKNEDGNGEGDLVRITDDGVTFKSHWDGKEFTFTPEFSMQSQWTLGSDIHIAFDDCTPLGVTEKQAGTSLTRTHRWAQESIDAHETCANTAKKEGKPYQALYGSVQGSLFESLRKKSASFISSLPFDGIAVGGVSVGETKKQMQNVLSWVAPLLPPDKPHHLLGVGELDDIIPLIAAGIDTFDCVQPSRMARMGMLYESKTDAIDITKSVFAEDMRPISPTCSCFTCRNFSRAYLYHLFHVRELLAYRLATIHNIFFVQSFVATLRSMIREGEFRKTFSSSIPDFI